MIYASGGNSGRCRRCPEASGVLRVRLPAHSSTRLAGTTNFKREFGRFCHEFLRWYVEHSYLAIFTTLKEVWFKRFLWVQLWSVCDPDRFPMPYIALNVASFLVLVASPFESAIMVLACRTLRTARHSSCCSGSPARRQCRATKTRTLSRISRT